MKTNKYQDVKYISYLSIGKINNLYAQVTDFMPSMVKEKRSVNTKADVNASVPSIFGILKAGLSFGGQRGEEVSYEGELDPIHKLKIIIEYFESSNKTADLNSCIDSKEIPEGTTCFSFRGAFRGLRNEEPKELIENNPSYIEQEEKETSYNPLYHGCRAVSDMGILKSEYSNFNLLLACSYKYFSDMGSSRVKVGEDYSDKDYFRISPHSGNWHFFAGKHSAEFEAILILTGQDGNTLYGSPIALINTFTPNLNV